MTIDPESTEHLAAAGAHAHEPDVVPARPVWIGVVVAQVTSRYRSARTYGV